MTRKFPSTVMASVMMVATIFAGSQMSAHAGSGQCGASETCMWGNNDYKWLIFNENNFHGNIYGEPNNEMDSWLNRSFSDSLGTAGRRGAGDCQSFDARESDNNVAPWNSDEISFVSTIGGC